LWKNGIGIFVEMELEREEYLWCGEFSELLIIIISRDEA